MVKVMVPAASITTYFIPNIDRESVAATWYKSIPTLLAIVSALAFSVVARADVIIALHQPPFLYAFAAAPGSNGRSQIIESISENPFNHTVAVADVNGSGFGQAANSLDLSFTDSSITSAGSSSAHDFRGKSIINPTVDSQEYSLLDITVTDQPVSFTLTASTSASGEGRSFISLSGTDVNVQYDTFTGGPQSGTTTGILTIGTYSFHQADGTPLPNVPSADGDSSSSAQLQISELALTGDFNRDGHIDAADIAPAMEALTNPSTYATDFGLTDPNLLSLIEDVNGDSSFTNADLQALLDLLKSGGGSADSVPEPPSLMLATLALLAVYSYRRLHQQVGFR
jgi:hypothetical protein